MDWLHTMHTSMETAILVLFTQHWHLNHACSCTLSGKMVAAPASLAGVKFHLAEEIDLELQGRVREWDPTAQSGNPVYSTQIRDMITKVTTTKQLN